MKGAERLLQEAIRQLERGVTFVQIPLSWGTVEWRASLMAIHGRAHNGAPFTIAHVGRHALLAWLQGKPIERTFPEMHPDDQTLLATGRCEETVLRLAKVYEPGATVLEYLESNGWTQHDLVNHSGLPLSDVQELCAGKTPITQEIAQALERALRRPASFWLNLQRLYDEAQ